MTTQNKTRKKLALSVSLILASFIYAFYQNKLSLSSVTSFKNDLNGNSVKDVVAQTLPTKSTSSNLPTNSSSNSKPKPTPTPPPAPKKTGQYTDGTYTGDPADAYYGIIQVEAIIRNGALYDVRFLQHPNDRNTSVRINNYAMPILRQEAISAQSANVDIVSGATDSSMAFQQSMDSALVQAK